MSTPGNPAAAQRVRDVVAPVVAAAGLVLEDVVVAPAGRRSVVRVVVDLDDAVGGLDLDTLGDVSRDVSAALDAADPVRGAFTLEVSTPGTDRPLTELRHFRRARTRLVRLTLRDGSVREGRLLDADATAYVLQTAPGTTEQIDPALVARGQVEVELARDDHDDDEEGPA